MRPFDIVILTESRYEHPEEVDDYIQNILTEDNLLKEALENLGLTVLRKDWADPRFDWSSTRSIIFRTTWDYFDRSTEFKAWLQEVEQKVFSFNPFSIIKWNMDKWYLKDLKEKGVRIVETQYIRRGEQKSLHQIVEEIGWKEIILKPTIAGTARHTYRINPSTIQDHESIFSELIANEDLMIQPFQNMIIEKGEVSHIVIGGEYTHSVLKKTKKGDFRVQDDFGGSLHEYQASKEEIEFSEGVLKEIHPLPAYARVDVMWNNEGELAVSEVELIEPELWFRRNKAAANKLAAVINEQISSIS